MKKDQISFQKLIVNRCLQNGDKQSSFTLLVYDLEVLMTSHPKFVLKYEIGCNFDKYSRFLKSPTVEL